MTIDTFRLQYELSPIILVAGSSNGQPGAQTPIISILQGQDFTNGILGGASIPPNSEIAHFSPLPDTSLEEIEVGHYPFANQYVAGNAIIFQPLKVTLLMLAPAPTQGGYNQKQNIFTTLKQTLDQHMAAGGTFNVNTPAYIFTSCLLLGLHDVTPPDQRQVQVSWQWTFEQPLLTQQSAQAAQSSLLSKISSGVQTTGDPPSQGGIFTTTASPLSTVGSSLFPALTPLGGASVVGGSGVPSSVGTTLLQGILS